MDPTPTSPDYRHQAYLVHMKIHKALADLDRAIHDLGQEDTDPVQPLLTILRETEFDFLEYYTQGNQLMAPASSVMTREVISFFSNHLLLPYLTINPILNHYHIYTSMLLPIIPIIVVYSL
jgi:hypothetical protein